MQFNGCRKGIGWCDVEMRYAPALESRIVSKAQKLLLWNISVSAIWSLGLWLDTQTRGKGLSLDGLLGQTLLLLAIPLSLASGVAVAIHWEKLSWFLRVFSVALCVLGLWLVFFDNPFLK